MKVNLQLRAQYGLETSDPKLSVIPVFNQEKQHEY